jgi:hypothetical protein
MWKNHEGMVQMVSEVIAVDQEQHPIKADYLDESWGQKWAGLERSDMIEEPGTRRNCSCLAPAALTSFSTQL